MKLLITILSLISVSAFAAPEGSFFYTNFDSCQETFTNFNRQKNIDNNVLPKYSLVCAQKSMNTECKLIDEKGKTIKEDKVTQSSNLITVTDFTGSLSGMRISIIKGAAGVFFTMTSPVGTESIRQVVCVGKIKDASDLKELKLKQKLLETTPEKVIPSNPQKKSEPDVDLIGD